MRKAPGTESSSLSSGLRTSTTTILRRLRASLQFLGSDARDRQLPHEAAALHEFPADPGGQQSHGQHAPPGTHARRVISHLVELVAEDVAQAGEGADPDQRAQGVEQEEVAIAHAGYGRPAARRRHSVRARTWPPAGTGCRSADRRSRSGVRRNPARATMRQMKRSTFAPRRRPSMNQKLSAIRQAAKPVRTIQCGPAGRLWPARRRPATGAAEGSGRAPCSARIQKNSSA